MHGRYPYRPDAETIVLQRVALLLLLACALPAHADDIPDPLRSPLWQSMRERFLADAPVVFDEHVRIVMPAHAEDSLDVPVAVHVDDLDDVVEVLVFADLNPIPKIVEYFPVHADAGFAFRFKVEQSTPVRAAAKTRDGTWHVGGAWLTAAGGGCTTPSLGTGKKLWQDRFGEVSARQWPRAGEDTRLRLRVMHPMDTGLAAGIPVFHLETLRVLDAEGTELARIQPYEPISENPVFTLDLHHSGAVQIVGRDIQGNAVGGSVAP